MTWKSSTHINQFLLGQRLAFIGTFVLVQLKLYIMRFPPPEGWAKLIFQTKHED